MHHSLSLVIAAGKVHCAVIPRGSASSYPITFDPAIKPHHTQYVLLQLGATPKLYGVTGTLPSQDLREQILAKWADRAGYPVLYLATLTRPENVTFSKTDIYRWVSEYYDAGELRRVALLRLLQPFSGDIKLDAKA